MSPAPNALPDSSPSDAPQIRPRLYTPGLSDPLGDRLLTFDNGTASSLELLKFKKALSDSPDFESALRKRVEEFSRFRHPSIAAVRGIEWLSEGDGLALVSIHTAGRRLSEILRDARGAAFAFELIRQLGPALVALQQAGAEFAHGALTPERVIVTREGRLVIVEHVLGGALESLKFPAARARSELGLVAPDAEPVKFNQRLDVIQLGVVALSLLVGRRLDATEYPANIAGVLDEFAKNDPAASGRLRPWLERALWLGARPFESAQEAFDAFSKLPEEAPASTSAAATTAVRPSAAGPSSAPEPLAASTHAADSPAKTATPAHQPKLSKEEDFDLMASTTPAATPVSTQWRSGRAMKFVKWGAAALALLAVGEGLVIAGLFTRPASVVVAPPPPRAELMALQPPAIVLPAPTPTSTPAAAAETPAPAAADKEKSSAPSPAATPSAPKSDAAAAAATAPADRSAAGSASRFGGIKVVCPIELQVFENNVLLGSTAGPIAVNEGSHALDVVNDTLGFRSRQTVTVKAGGMTSLTVPIPDGRVSINAVPWADVLIDGNAAGQTPIANLSLRIGQHDIVFRHPQLGEQHQTVIVKTEGLTRVSAVLQK